MQDLSKLVDKKKVKVVLVAFSKLAPAILRQIISTCREKKLQIKKLVDQQKGSLMNYHFKLFQPEELLGREPLSIDVYSIENMIKDKVVLITGAGGSIGSEICRQIAKYRPKLLIFLRSPSFFSIVWRTNFSLTTPIPILFLYSEIYKTKNVSNG